MNSKRARLLVAAWLVLLPKVVQTSERDAGVESRRYDNTLRPIENVAPLLADHPQFIQPVVDSRRFEAAPLIEEPGADLHVRAWRYSYNAGGIIEMDNHLRAAATTLVVVHPWGIDDGQGWETPRPAGAAYFCTEEKNRLAGRHMGEVVRPFLDSLRGRVSFVLYSLPRRQDPLRQRLYGSLRERPEAGDRARGAEEMRRRLEDFDYRGQPLPQTLSLSPDNPVGDYFEQFPGLAAGASYNNDGFWSLPIPIHRQLAPADEDLVVYDGEGYDALREFLRQQGIRHVLLTGYATDMCVRTSTAGYENLSRDFNVFLVGDATLATFPASATPRYATHAAVAQASLNQLITQISWIRMEPATTE